MQKETLLLSFVLESKNDCSEAKSMKFIFDLFQDSVKTKYIKDNTISLAENKDKNSIAVNSLLEKCFKLSDRRKIRTSNKEYKDIYLSIFLDRDKFDLENNNFLKLLKEQSTNFIAVLENKKKIKFDNNKLNLILISHKSDNNYEYTFEYFIASFLIDKNLKAKEKRKELKKLLEKLTKKGNKGKNLQKYISENNIKESDAIKNFSKNYKDFIFCKNECDWDICKDTKNFFKLYLKK